MNAALGVLLWVALGGSLGAAIVLLLMFRPGHNRGDFPMSETPRPEVQDPDRPDLALFAAAAARLRLILEDPERDLADKRHAIDALGRALLRIKQGLS